MSDSTSGSPPRLTCEWERPVGDAAVEIRDLPGVGSALVYAGPTERYDALSLANSDKLLEAAVEVDLLDPENVRAFAQDWGFLGVPPPFREDEAPPWFPDKAPAGRRRDEVLPIPTVEALGAWQVGLRLFQNAYRVQRWANTKRPEERPEELAFLEQWYLQDFGEPSPSVYQLAHGFLEGHAYEALRDAISVETDVRWPGPVIRATPRVTSLLGALWVALVEWAAKNPVVQRACQQCGRWFLGNNPTRKYCSEDCKKRAWEPRRGC